MIHQCHRHTDRRMDGQTTCDSKTVLCTVVHRAVKTHRHNISNNSNSNVLKIEKLALKGYSSSFFFPSFTISSSSRVILRLTNGDIRTSKVANQSSTKEHHTLGHWHSYHVTHHACKYVCILHHF